MSQIRLPDDFDAEIYLDLNPDVRKAGINPADHYLSHGRAEKRTYKRLPAALRPKIDRPYESDGLRSIHNHDFMESPDFMDAYSRGIQASGKDYLWYWRVHIGLWAAKSAVRVAGDFVECGVNRGFLSSAIMRALDWSSEKRTFYLLDTFNGMDARYVSATEKEAGILKKFSNETEGGLYTQNLAAVTENFSEWNNVRIVSGSVPETLEQIESDQIAFVHIDMNCSPPEVEAIESMWDRVSTGGIVLLDDYAYYGYQTQKEGMDAWAQMRSVPIASLPTGQGLIVKA